MAQEKDQSESIQDLFRFFEQHLGGSLVHWLKNDGLHGCG
jgi:hypothetical protein